MATIYKINDVLHGCDKIDYIINDAKRMKDEGRNIEAFIYLIGCYASATGDQALRAAWRMMRKLYNLGFTGGALYHFKQTYNGACCRIRYTLGQYAWYHTLTFEI